MTVAVFSLPAAVGQPQPSAAIAPQTQALRETHMNRITTKDGISILYKDWGTGPTVVFSHGWH